MEQHFKKKFSFFFCIITATKRQSTTSTVVNTNNLFLTRARKEFISKRVNALTVGFRREKFLALLVSRLFSRILISKEYIKAKFLPLILCLISPPYTFNPAFNFSRHNRELFRNFTVGLVLGTANTGYIRTISQINRPFTRVKED